jgi:hypothetical protein
MAEHSVFSSSEPHASGEYPRRGSLEIRFIGGSHRAVDIPCVSAPDFCSAAECFPAQIS